MEDQNPPKGCRSFAVIFIVVNFIMLCYGWANFMWPYLKMLKNYLWNLL